MKTYMKNNFTKGNFVWETDSKKNVLFMPDMNGKFRLYSDGAIKYGATKLVDKFRKK